MRWPCPIRRATSSTSTSRARYGEAVTVEPHVDYEIGSLAHAGATLRSGGPHDRKITVSPHPAVILHSCGPVPAAASGQSARSQDHGGMGVSIARSRGV